MKHLLSLGLLALAGQLYSATPEVKASAKAILATNQNSVLWVFAVSSTVTRYEGNIPGLYRQNGADDANENRSEFLSTVIDADGYLVASLSELEARDTYEYRGMNVKETSTTQIQELKVIQTDGTEIPADLILKDEDLDIAIIKIRASSPEAQGVTWKPVNMAAAGAAETLDDVISLSRMRAALERTPKVEISELAGLVSKPRPFYIADVTTGCPLFCLDGKLLGIGLMHQSSQGDMDVSEQVVLPTADVRKILDQAKKLPVPVKKPAKPEAKKAAPDYDSGKPEAEGKPKPGGTSPTK